MQIVILATDILVQALPYIAVLELFQTNNEKNSPFKLALSNATREEDNFIERNFHALESFGLVSELINPPRKS